MSGEQLLALCKDALATAGEPEAEAFAVASLRGCARFAMGELREHMELEEARVIVRVAHGRRVAEASTSVLDASAIASAVRSAARAARAVPELPDFPGFADAGSDVGAPPRFAASTAETTAASRAEALGGVLDTVRRAGLVSAGMLETSTRATAVATTRGCARAHDATVASFKVWALETAGSGGAAGYGGCMHRDVGALDLAGETERAVRIATLAKGPTLIDPGDYDVVMEPAAITEILEWLAATTFGAPELERGTSAFAGRLGERLTGETISIVEDPLDASELGFGVPFDREGTPRERVVLVDRGVARAALYDRTHAVRANTRPTGSAIADGLFGTVGASALQLAPGSAASTEELIAGMPRGLYVCRLHYVNGYLDTRRAAMTGLTRDGCFLVEKGRIVRPVHNLRFTDGFLDALARCDGMTAGRSAIPTWWTDGGATVAPAVRLRRLHFSGASQPPALAG